MKQNPIIYLIVTFAWTWTCWIGAYAISQAMGHSLVTGATLFDLMGQFSAEKGLFPQVLFALGVYAPLISYLLVGRGQKRTPIRNIDKHFAAMAVIIPLVIAIPTVILSVMLGYFTIEGSTPWLMVGLMGLYFISNFLTSGTEEFGWRGFLYPYLRKKESAFWKATWKGGLIWAVWHYPLLVILYMGQGPWVLMPSLVGFTAGIVGMNYITNFIYEKTRSIPVVMGMHALNNTVSFGIILFFPQTPFLVLTSVMAWVVVVYFDKKQYVV